MRCELSHITVEHFTPDTVTINGWVGSDGFELRPFGKLLHFKGKSEWERLGEIVNLVVAELNDEVNAAHLRQSAVDIELY